MKGKSSAATLGLVGGLALGVWIGAEMLPNRDITTSEPAAVAATAAAETPAPESTPKLVMTIPVSAPELHARMKPVLARGTKMPLAVEGFTDAEQFAALAHAARNTQVPFILL